MRFTVVFRASAFALALQASPLLAEDGKTDDVAVPADTQAKPEAKAEKKKDDGGFQLKPRWRVQFDIADVSGPDTLNAAGMGGSEKLRRAYIGVDAKLGSNLSARAELEFASPDPEFVDLYVAYDKGPVNVTLGQQKPFTNLDDMTSDVYTSFAERAAFVSAFNFTRRLGLSGTYTKGKVMVSAGVFTDPLIGLNDADKNSLGVDARAVWMPKLGKTQFHLGGTVHWRDRNDLAPLGQRYRHRPFTRTNDSRFVATRSMIVDRELSYGLEAAAINGPFHVAGEVHWMKADRPALPNVGMFGGYAEAGVFLTGESRPYKSGSFGGVKPKRPVGEGGFGALQVNVRYDYLDLNDRSASVTGGKQNGYLASLIWIPIEKVRIIANYARLDYRDAAIPLTNGSRDYGLDVFVVRFQIHY